MARPTNFRCIILSPKNLVYEKEITSLFLQGDRGEFELLAYHYPLVGILTKGDVVIDQTKRIPVKSGIVRFYANECTVLIEETPETMMAAKEIIKAETAKT
jgi:F0F1-type ATP synthase epsilon subunit